MILDDIVARKRKTLETAKEMVPLALLEKMIGTRSPAEDFEAALRSGGVSLIAEIKKASPSKGLLCPNLNAEALACLYAVNGASAISVLTESHFFQGDLSYLLEARKGVEAGLASPDRYVPLLRKDFLFDAYQIYEARAFGADAVLLIAAILDDDQLSGLLGTAHSLGMKCLVEVHDQVELERAALAGCEIIGINNRDLRTFTVDLNTTRTLAAMAPSGMLLVAESGIHTRDDVRCLAEWGVSAMLVGEALVTAGDLAAKMKELLS